MMVETAIAVFRPSSRSLRVEGARGSIDQEAHDVGSGTVEMMRPTVAAAKMGGGLQGDQAQLLLAPGDVGRGSEAYSPTRIFHHGICVMILYEMDPYDRCSFMLISSRHSSE